MINAENLLTCLVSVAFGALSAVAPLANAEAYVIAAQAAGAGQGVLVGASIGVGQTIGKCALFLGVRHGRNLPIFHRFRRSPDRPPRFPRLAGVVAKLLALVGSRWGIPITLLAAVIGFPPLYAVSLVAGASPMPLPVFAVTVLIGRCTRFILLGLGIDAGLGWLTER
jgi:membrane protein YqaA with SNARE-associated domain